MTASGGAVTRLRAAAGRLRAAAAAVDEAGLTPPDPRTGERWERGQVLSHCAEMIPYWVDEVERLVAAGGGRPFGRVKTDPERLARIEAHRGDDPYRLLGEIDAGVDVVEALLGRLTPADLALRGEHPTLGVMGVDRIVEEFLVSHLEEHADQLERLARR